MKIPGYRLIVVSIFLFAFSYGAAAAALYQKGEELRITVSKTKLKTGPKSFGTSVIKTLSMGEKVLFLGSSGIFHKVKYGTATGFIPASSLVQAEKFKSYSREAKVEESDMIAATKAGRPADPNEHPGFSTSPASPAKIKKKPSLSKGSDSKTELNKSNRKKTEALRAVEGFSLPVEKANRKNKTLRYDLADKAESASFVKNPEADGKSFRSEGGLGEFAPDTNQASRLSAGFKPKTPALTEEEQYYLGRNILARLLILYKMHPDKKAGDYISAIGQTLALASSRPETFAGYRFIILDAIKERKAFSIPGGFILITSGTVKNVKNEDELAAIIAHEIAHSALFHPSDSASNNYRVEMEKAQVGFEMGNGGTLEEKLKKVASIMDSLAKDFLNSTLSGYPEKEEVEADQTALSMMADAGYNPDSLRTYLLKSSANSGLKKEMHGDLSNRLKEVKSALRKSKTRFKTDKRRKARFSSALSSF